MVGQGLIGRQFGQLIPIMEGLEVSKSGTRVLCVCDCGNEIVVARYSLLDKKRPVKSCEDCGRKRAGQTRTTHGHAGTRIYHIWCGMRQRCFDPKNKDYPRYGGRGISIHPDWMDISEFAYWCVTNGYNDTLTIDRKDVNGNYEPSNCRFITFSENSSLTRNTHLLEAFGETKTISQWVKDSRCKVASGTLYARWKYQGWDVENAITIPASPKNKSRRLHG